MKQSINKSSLIILLVFMVFTLSGCFLINRFANSDRTLQSVVKANMHTLQHMLSIYAVEWNGLYPDNVQELYIDAVNRSKPYWKEFANPYNSAYGVGQALNDERGQKVPGIVTFKTTNENRYYFIYGYNGEGMRIQTKGKDYYLTNS